MMNAWCLTSNWGRLFKDAHETWLDTLASGAGETHARALISSHMCLCVLVATILRYPRSSMCRSSRPVYTSAYISVVLSNSGCASDCHTRRDFAQLSAPHQDFSALSHNGHTTLAHEEFAGYAFCLSKVVRFDRAQLDRVLGCRWTSKACDFFFLRRSAFTCG